MATEPGLGLDRLHNACVRTHARLWRSVLAWSGSRDVAKTKRSSPSRGRSPGRNARIAPFDRGWYIEVVIPHPAGACWMTLEAIGLTQAQAIAFAQSVQGS